MTEAHTTTTPLPTEAIPAMQGALERSAATAFKAANRAGQEARTTLWGLSMSALGTCTRQGAYRLSATPPTDPALSVDAEARAALLGTWLHAGFLPYIADRLYNARHEVPVTLTVGDTTVHGTLDVYTQAMGGGVVDLKTVGSHKLGEVTHTGPRDEHRIQVQGYALAAQQAGMPVAWTAWLYLDRDTGDLSALVEPFGPEQATEVQHRVRELRRWTTAPDHAPRTQRGPGLSVVCDGCPWLKQCWGPEAEPGDSKALAVQAAEDIAFAAMKYIELREEQRTIKWEMEAYGAMVGTPPQGSYGDTTITYGAGSETLNAEQAITLMRLHGLNPPMAHRGGSRYIRRGTKRSR